MWEEGLYIFLNVSKGNENQYCITFCTSVGRIMNLDKTVWCNSSNSDMDKDELQIMFSGLSNTKSILYSKVN